MPIDSHWSADHVSLAAAVLACLIVLLGHAGFALYEAGLSRAQNASNAMTMNALLWPLCAIGFFATGFAFLCGGGSPAIGLDRWLIHIGSWRLLSGKGFFLRGFSTQPVVLLTFFVTLSRVSIAATIPSGAAAERWKFKSFFLFSLITSSLIIPIYGSWIWGDGWLTQFNSRTGHSAIDYAGSSVIHMLGGVLALACTWSLGPRTGKFDLRGRPRPILGHHIPMAVLGCLIIAIGLLALNILPALLNADGQLMTVAVNSILAAAAGATTACVYMAWRFGKPDPTMICNGLLAGLVAIAAPCSVVTPGIALLIGGAAGILATWSISFWEARGIDDPCGVISVHGVGGAWGVLSLGLFYGGAHQLGSQCVMIVACLIWGLLAGGVALVVIGWLLGSNRVSPQAESSGLDISEVGVPAYRELLNPIMASSLVAPAPRPASSPMLGGKTRFSIVIEGIDSVTLINVWSGLCQAGSGPPSADFKEVYPHLTTITGNRFRFRGGEPVKIRESLRRLFENAIDGAAVSTRVES